MFCAASGLTLVVVDVGGGVVQILDYSSADLLLSVLLGVLCGLAGAVYVGSIQTLCLLRNR